ncbi:putative GroES-like superfamily, polyketide synthase, enoylreductase domain-containing protein [Plasmopara halstedii]
MSSSPRTVHTYASFGKGEEMKPWKYTSRPLGVEDVEIKISHCGICGSDLHTIDSGWGPSTYPCVVGHEIVGEVTLAGSNVKTLKVGDRVGVGAQVWACLNKDPAAPCKECASGDDAYCTHKVWTYNDTYKNDGASSYGGYADYVRVAQEYAFQIPDNIPSDVAAPLLCAGVTVFTPLKEANVEPGKRVGVVGIGGLGHLAIQFAKAMGAEVVAFSTSATKEAEVRALGATEFVVFTDNEQATAAAGSVDVLLICASADNMPYMLFLSFLKVRGTCIMVGLPNTDVQFHAFGVVGKGAKFVGSNIGSIQNIKEMLQVAAEKNVRAVIQKLPMSKVNEGIKMVRDGTVRYRSRRLCEFLLSNSLQHCHYFRWMETEDHHLPGQIPQVCEVAIEETSEYESSNTRSSTSPLNRISLNSDISKAVSSPKTKTMASRPSTPLKKTSENVNENIVPSNDGHPTMRDSSNDIAFKAENDSGSTVTISSTLSPLHPPMQQTFIQSDSPRTLASQMRSLRRSSITFADKEVLKPIKSSSTPTQPYRRQTMERKSSNARMASRLSRQIGRSGSVPKFKEREPVVETDNPVDNEETGDMDELTFTLPELSKDGNVTGRTVRESWPIDHVMVLYMLSRYAVSARTKEEKESWIRQIPLLVLMYEGIAAGAINFDYAPAAMVIAQEGRPKRIWMNTTQDGKSAIDDLREADLINGLKLSTKDYHSVTAFQVSFRGLQLLSQVSKELIAKVDSFIFAPKPYRRELLKIRYIPIRDPPDGLTASETNVPAWTYTNESHDNLTSGVSGIVPIDTNKEPEFNEEGRFILESIGYFRYSGVTETEDVSYVSSPFVPQCVRSLESHQQLSSNAHRALEAAGGQSNIRDTLSEAIVLANPVCLVGEWIPFGSNQIVALNERLGSMDRCQGGLFTSLIDDRPTDTQFEVPPGLTEVRILDYDPVRYINFEAEINFPEDDGIVQVENFGIHLNVDGTIFYGIKVDAILDKRADRISVDLLSRLLVDIHQDSSEIMNDLLSSYQTSLLDMVFLGDIANRGKFNMIMADQIDPFMPELEYMDRGDFENELKQVLGDIHCAYDIGDDSVLIVGRDGILIAGSASKRFEKVFISYFSLLCREMFLRSFFTRIFVLEELLKHIRELIFRAKEDPHHLVTIRGKLNQATNDLILFTDTMGYLLESLEVVKIPQKSANASEEEEMIFSYLDLKKQHHDILLRARDLEKLVHGARYEIVNLRQMAEVLNTSELEDIFKLVEGNTKELADSSLTVEQCGSSLELVQVLLAGSFAFTLLDRIPGGSLNVEMPQWVNLTFAKTIIDVPLLFFVLNILWMVGCVYALIRYKKSKTYDVEHGRRTLHIKVNKAIDIDNFEIFLNTRVLEKQESVSQLASEVRRVVWKDFGLQPCSDERAHPRKSIAYVKGSVSWKHKVIDAMMTRLEKWQVRTKDKVNEITAVSTGKATSSYATSGLLESGIPVEIEVEYDSRYGFLLFVTFKFQIRDKKLSCIQQIQKKGFQMKEWIRHGSRTATKSKQKPDESTCPRNETLILEEELMSWFAMEMKQHGVIKSIDIFLAAL